MAFKHGIYVDEVKTQVPSPAVGSSGIQVVFGTAPINLAADPTAVTNVPVLCSTYEEAVEKLGFSTNFEGYTLCQSMYASFKIAKVAPVVFVNVLDPTKHTKSNAASDVTITNKQGTYKVLGVLLSSVVVKNGETSLTVGTDYTLSFDDDGYVLVSIMSLGAAAAATKLSVSSTSIDPTKVTYTDVIGGSDAEGNRTGMELLKDVYPTCQVIPGTLVAPGWATTPAVGVALCAKCEEINGAFRAFAFVDLDSSVATRKDLVASTKEAAGFSDSDSDISWPLVKAGDDGYTFSFSAVKAAGVQALDAANGDVPSRSPSNVDMGITATVLADGTEIYLDFEDANVVNAAGVSTAINAEGWKTWGNHTAAYPDATDPKDIWTEVRRMFSWQANTFVKNYLAKIDNNISYVLIQAIIDEENVRCNSLKARGSWAGGRLVFKQSENPLANILAGKIIVHQYIAPFIPSQEIDNTLEYDLSMLMAALQAA